MEATDSKRLSQCATKKICLLAAILAAGNCLSRADAYLDVWQDLIPRGNSLGGIVSGNGRLVAVGGNAELLTATNSASWQKQGFPAAHFITDAAYGNGRFLAVGSVTNQLGMAIVSTNATDWLTNITGPSRLDGCAFGNGMFVAIGNGTLLSSPDGQNWTSRRPTNALALYGVDFINDHFIAVGGSGLTTTSPDGILWSTPTTDGGPELRASAYGNGTTVTVGDAERIKTTSATTSADHWDWQSEIQFWDLAYGNGRFVAVGFVFTFGVIYTSTNGFDWTRPILGETPWLYRIAFANGEFVAVGAQGVILTSTDGLKWTLRRGGLIAPMVSVAADPNGKVVAVAGAYSAPGSALTSSGDLTWQIQTWGYNNYPTRILYTNGQFLAVGSGAVVSTSLNGIGWTHRTNGISGTLNDVIYAQGSYVAVGSIFGGGGLVTRSSDSVTWSNQDLGPNKYLYGVAYGNGRFVTVGSDGLILSSPDAVAWTQESAGVTSWLHAVSFGKDLFVAVGGGGTILRSTNSQNWAIQDSGTMNDLWGVRYLADRFIALGANGTILSSFDGITWQTHLSGVLVTLYDATVAENRIWVVGASGTALVSEHAVYPVLQPVGWRTDSGFAFRLPVDLGRPCRLQGSSDFAIWEDLGIVTSSDTNQVYLDSCATNAPMRFYRGIAE